MAHDDPSVPSSPERRAPMDDASRAELDELTAQLRAIRLDLESQRHHSAHSPQSYSKTSAFIVDAERLKWLDKILSNVPGQRKYDVRTSDGNTSNFDNFEDVLNFPNTKSKGINEIRINITEDYMDNMDLSIKGDRRSDNLRYR